MTLKEMGGEYRAQALVLQARIRELREACRQAETEGEKEKLRQRIWALAIIWQETREQAALLERYYERGYRRNGRYTL
ncbi:MAG: hypothetical protein ACI3VS_09325 [Evtepia sp.]|uniref:hypothetical protein n=1 Tax=Evtepia sp. TaxID=2773933 RepID=UPI00298662E4|nr:hypothetical protein [Evtepia sp.]MDD7289173.1 hypothetical protein [Clostridiales bacterium]MDY3992257.1 hypothetical protein [Evtepia sp.]MDY4429376.1 hypothetical protein [Evtepia sp.]